LGYEALDAGLACGSQQVVRSLRSQSIADRKDAVEMPKIRDPFEIGHLVHNRVGLCCLNRTPYCCGIKAIRDQGLTAELSDEPSLVHAARRTHDLVPGSDQPWKKVSAYGAGSAGDKDPHDLDSENQVGRARAGAPGLGR